MGSGLARTIERIALKWQAHLHVSVGATLTPLLSAIAATKPREKAGSRTAARYDFQLNASFLKVLEWHNEGTDYIAIFDLIDDLVLIANPKVGSKASLYQIKSKGSGHWSAADISKLPKGEIPRSIVGKMYSGVLLLAGNADRAVFLTNADFKFAKLDGTKTSADDVDIEAATLHSSEIDKLKTALDEDYAPPQAYDLIPLLRFERTSLGIQSQSDLVIGKLVTLFEQKFGASAVPVTAVYQTLSEQIRRKSANSDAISTEDDLLRNKALTFSEVDAVLKKAVTSDTVEKLWSLADAEFSQASMSSRERIDLRNSAIKYSLERNGGHVAAQAIHQRAKVVFSAEAAAIASIGSLLGLASFLTARVHPEPPFEGVALRAAMIVEAIEEMNSVP